MLERSPERFVGALQLGLLRLVPEVQLPRSFNVVEAPYRRLVGCFLEAGTVLASLVRDCDHRIDEVIQRLLALGLGWLDQ